MIRPSRAREEGRRLAPSEVELLDRGKSFHFTFDGQPVEAFEGDTIASALYATGQRTLSRSFKYHRPRGLLCAAGDCPNCLVQVGSEPNVRACQRPVEPGLRVRSQNRWPSLSRDALNLAELGDRFLPPGFYYKAFLRPRFLWPLYEEILRHIAGLGKVDTDASHAPSEKEYRHPDVVVLGGGAAGLQAALSAAQSSAQVLLIEENRNLGGHLLYARGQHNGQMLHRLARDLTERVSGDPRIEALTGTNLFGWYEDRWLAAARQDRLYKIRPRAVVLATGSHEVPLVFEGNDLPGILLSGAAQRLIRLWGVRPGDRAVVVSPHRHGCETALDLVEAGVAVELVANPAGDFDDDLASKLERAGVTLAAGMTVQKASGRGELERVWLSPSTGGEGVAIKCDLLVASAGFTSAFGPLLQAGGEVEWRPDRGEFLPTVLPPGAFLAGDVAGPRSLEASLEAGSEAGRRAVEYAHGASQSQSPQAADPQAQSPSPRPRTASPLGPSLQKKSFVCFCEDVTCEDLEHSIKEGYDSLELLKRYSTVSMGPCQGKMCNLASIQLTALETDRSVPATGRTTARPPTRPVKMGALAGQPMEPIRRTPMHDWHKQNEAEMMVAGAWMRPEHYGDPIKEVEAVRQRVGLIDVSTLGKFHLHGPDAPILLERLYTNRWRGLDVGRVRYGVMVTEEGIVFDDGVTARLGEDFYYLTTTSSGVVSVHEWIEWWLQSGWDLDVHVHNATDLRGAMNLTGPLARQVLAELTEGVDLGPEAFPYLHARQAEVAGVPALLLRIGFTGELGFEIHTPSGYGLHVWQAILKAGERHGIEPFGVEAQRVLRLEKGHLIVGQDTDSLSNPFEAGMDWAVKLEKDDFLGRAFLVQSRGDAPQRILVGFEVPDGTRLQEANQVVARGEGPLGLRILGRVTSVRWSPTLDRVIGLAWVPAERSEPGTELTIRSSGRLVRAVVRELPFYDPAGERLRA